jgi:hypothetical protein
VPNHVFISHSRDFPDRTISVSPRGVCPFSVDLLLLPRASLSLRWKVSLRIEQIRKEKCPGREIETSFCPYFLLNLTFIGKRYIFFGGLTRNFVKISLL